jgi:ABC-type nitrate/sulfonate/bicarbonate transport system substrate-binding protein
MIKRPGFHAAVVLALAGLAAAGCSSSSSSSTGGSAASTSSPPASAVNLSSVTLNIGDQKGTGAEAVLSAAGLLNTLPFHVTWSDFTSGPPMLQAMASGSVDIGGVGDAPPYSFEVASKAAVADPAKASAIKAYLVTLDKAYVWAATHPSAWAVAWGKAAGLPASVMNVAAKVDATTPVPVTSAIVASEQNLVNQFYAAGLVPTKVEISNYITTEFNGTLSGSS